MMRSPSAQKYRALSSGFRSVDLSDAEEARLLRSSDEWEVLAGILLSCQTGNFSELPRILKLLRTNDTFRFWKAATELIGYAGNWDLIQQLFSDFQSEINDSGVQYFLAIALGNSCGLWAVERLLDLHAAAVEDDSRYQIGRHLSYLLEEENDVIWFGAEEKTIVGDSEDIDVRRVVDYDGFAAEVRAARDEIVEKLGSAEKPIFEGTLLDVNATARRLYNRLISKDEEKGRIYRERMTFEAFTGVDCSGFFDDNYAVQYLAGAAVMESFLESDAVKKFERGRRYFFGYPISTYSGFQG
jgi:hypothetical protein